LTYRTFRDFALQVIGCYCADRSVTVHCCDTGGNVGLEPGTSSVPRYYKRGWHGGYLNGPVLKRPFVRSQQSPIILE
jgi:hypothetical protein